VKKKVVLEIAGGLLMLLFTYAGVSKILQFKKFIRQLDNQPLPNSWTPLLSYAIPGTELAMVILLAVSACRRWGFLLSALFMLVFTVYAALILSNGFSYVPCSCGGVIEQLTWKQHLVFNVVFLLISIWGTVLSFQKISREPA